MHFEVTKIYHKTNSPIFNWHWFFFYAYSNPNITSFEHSLYIDITNNIMDIGLGVRVFANGPGRVIPKTQKMVLDASLLNTQHYKVRFKGKVEQSSEGVAPSPTHWCSSYRKGSLRVTLDYGCQLYLLIYIYIYIYICGAFNKFLDFFCTGIWNCCRLLKIHYVIAIHLMRWLTNFYDFRFK